MHEYPAKILVVLLKAVVQLFNILLVEETKHAFFQLSRALAGDNLYQSNLLFYSFRDNPVEFRINREALIINVVQIQDYLRQKIPPFRATLTSLHRF